MPLELTVTTIGDGGAGKTALEHRYVQNHFEESPNPHAVCDPVRKEAIVDEIATLLSFDEVTAKASDPVPSWRSQRLRGENVAFLFVYSIASRASFESITALHAEVQESRGGRSFPMVLVGAKCDVERERDVSVEEGQELARTLQSPFYETSSRTGIHVHNCYEEVIREWFRMQAAGSSKKKCTVS